MTRSITRRTAMSLAGAGAGVALVPVAGLANTTSRERLEAAVDELRAALREHYRCDVFEWVKFEVTPPKDGYSGSNPVFTFVPEVRQNSG